VTRAAGIELLSPREVAAIFGTSVFAVRDWRKSGRLLVLREPGCHPRYFGAEVRALRAGTDPAAARNLGLAERARLPRGHK
jgi:hypothetical protein